MPELTTQSAAVTTPHPRCAAAALDALKSGGNAIDAAVAALLAATVLLPDQVALGGYGGALTFYQSSTNKTFSIDFDARAPKGFRPDLYPRSAPAQRGYLALATPGIVAGLHLALQKFGTKTWREVSAHAVQLADEGFPVDARLQTALRFFLSHADPTSIRALLPDPSLPRIGSTFTQKDLAKTLRLLNDDPAAFYHGDIAARIAKQVRSNGGLLSEKDLADYFAKILDPLHVTYRNHDLYTAPPPAGGITSLSILKTLEQFDLSTYHPWGAPYLELFAESAKLAWQDRVRWLGDPDFVKVPLDEFLSEAAAKSKADKIRSGHWAAEHRVPPTGQHTVHVTAIDRDRNMVSLTATQGETFGSCVVIEGLGIPLGHGMSRFTYPDHDPPFPHSPNAPAPGKRMQHNMSPSLILKDGKPYSTLGLPGGTRIVTVTAQLIASLIDFHATPIEAVRSPKIHTEGTEPLALSAGTPKETAAELELMGHKVQRNGNTGGASSVITLAPDNRLSAATAYPPNSIAAQ